MEKCNIKYNLPKTEADVDAAIAAAIESATGSKAAIQQACVSILHHIQKHGDYSRANMLVDGLPEGINKQSLVKWFAQFGCLKSGKAEGETLKQFNGFKVAGKNAGHDEAKEAIKATFADARKRWWSDMMPKKDPHDSFDLNQKLADMANMISRKRKAAKDNPDKEYSFDVKDTTIQSFLNALPFDLFDRVPDDSEDAPEAGIKA